VNVRLGQRIQQIRTDSTHGASWLAKEAVETLVDAVETGEDPLEVGRELVGARPSIGAVAGAVGRVLAAGRTPEQLVEEARALIAGRERAAKAIAVLLRDRVGGVVVMTHSASATAREALLHGEPPARVVCTVSEPVGEGRWFSEELRNAGLAVDLVADDDATAAVETAGLLLFGADTVFRDGSLVNKVGTRRLAEAAREARVPVVVACEVIKLSPVEAAEPDEDRFELTPPELVELYVTEEGVYPPEEIGALIDRTPLLVDGYELLRSTVA
jgi:translation initiation factor 2B subunit (eIF-2B alpha/beta/delta family)